MTRFEKWVKDTKIFYQLQVAFICKHYDGNCKSCPLNHICTDDTKVYEYLNAESEGEGMTVSLTDIEIQRVLDACNGYIEIMGEGEDTHEYTKYEIETGLGSALRKIYKGRNGERAYAEYKTVRHCPTFDEWKANRTESEDK